MSHQIGILQAQQSRDKAQARFRDGASGHGFAGDLEGLFVEGHSIFRQHLAEPWSAAFQPKVHPAGFKPGDCRAIVLHAILARRVWADDVKSDVIAVAFLKARANGQARRHLDDFEILTEGLAKFFFHASPLSSCRSRRKKDAARWNAASSELGQGS